MPFTGKTEFGKIVAAKLRSQLVLDGLFAHPFEGDMPAAAVNVPLTFDEEASEYSKTNLASNAPTYDSNKYITLPINHDLYINKYIDGLDVATASYDEKKDALERGAYSVALSSNKVGMTVLINGAQGLDEAGTAFASTDPRYQQTGSVKSVGSDDIYDALVDLAGKLTDQGVPMENRFLIVNGDGQAKIMASNKTIRQGDMAQELVKKGFIAQIAGFNVKASNLVTGNVGTGSSAKKIYAVAGHPLYGANPTAFKVEPNLFDGNGDSNVVGGGFVKGRVATAYAVLNPKAFGLLTA